MEERDKVQEAARDASRRMQDAAKKGQERVREASNEATQMAAVAADALGVWMQVNQQVIRDLMDLSANAAQQNARLLTDIQRANVQALQEMQVEGLRMLSMWPEALRDPVRYYQRVCEEGLDGVNRTFGLGQRNGEAVTQSFERMQSAAEATTRGLQEAFRDAGKRMQEVVQRAERMSAA
jgi:hypothetical protein